MCEICGLLEETDSSDSRGTGGEAHASVFQSDATDGEDGDTYSTTNFGEKVQPLRRAECRLGRRSENRTKEQIIRSGIGRGSRRFERMARNPGQKDVARAAGRYNRLDQTLCFFEGQSIFTQMNAGGALGKGHIETVV